MSILEWITGAPKLVENVFDREKGLLTQVGSWVGGQQFTDQERAEFDVNMSKAVHAYSVATLDENTDRSKARRTIAVEWIRMQSMLIKLSVLLLLVDKFIYSMSGNDPQLFESVNQVTFSPYLWGITGAISLFFFGTHSLRSSRFAKEK